MTYSTNGPLRVGIVVVSYNGEKWIRQCLDSTRETGLNLKVIVVDNGSVDSTAEIIKAEYPEVLFLQQGQNLGFGRANNLGIKKMLELNCEYVFLLNQDARLLPGTLSALVEIADSDKSLGILSPVHLNWEGTKFDPYVKVHISSSLTNWANDVLFGQEKAWYPIDFVPAALWLLRGEALLKVGGFDPLFTHRGEDNDLINRMKYHGYSIGIAPRVFACHLHDGFSNHHTFQFLRKAFLTVSICRLNDPRCNLMRESTVLLLESFFYSVLDMARGRRHHAIPRVIGSMNALGKISTIRSHRTMSKTGGPLWLNLEDFQVSGA